MDTEIEATFTNIDSENIRIRLQNLNATCIHSQRLMRRKNFDYPDARLYAVKGWVRLRDEGDKVTLAYKQLMDRTIQGMKEVSVEVHSLEETEKFLKAIGLEEKSYQETKRESWELNGVQIEIDTWPWIPTFLEIEGATEELVKETSVKLGFSWDHALHGSVENVYQEVYDVTEEEIDDLTVITFNDVPQWLEDRRRQ